MFMIRIIIAVFSLLLLLLMLLLLLSLWSPQGRAAPPRARPWRAPRLL